MQKWLSAIVTVSAFYCVAVFWCPPVDATPVYKWEDRNGVVHFSSKQPSKDAKPAELAPIMRGEVKLADRKLVSCDKHGGTNCGAGADTDGSIICYDGFRDATARFRFTCSAPKLEITDVSDPKEDGSFIVFVRNSKSVAASDPEILFKTSEGKDIKLKGPNAIDPFGLAEFQFLPPSGTMLPEKPNVAQLTITCSNCPQ